MNPIITEFIKFCSIIIASLCLLENKLMKPICRWDSYLRFCRSRSTLRFNRLHLMLASALSPRTGLRFIILPLAQHVVWLPKIGTSLNPRTSLANYLASCLVCEDNAMQASMRHRKWLELLLNCFWFRKTFQFSGTYYIFWWNLAKCIEIGLAIGTENK